MFARISAFVIWSLVAAAAVFWLLRLTTSAPRAPAYAIAVGKSPAARGDLNRLFGAPPTIVAAVEAVPEAPSRFKLVGVMAPRSKDAQATSGSGLALIAVDGKPARAFAVGAPLDSGLVLQSVGLRTASLGPAQGARSVLLEIPALAPPNTGVLPQPGFAGAPAMSIGAVPPSGFAGSPVPMSGAGADMPLPTANSAPPQPAPIVSPLGRGGFAPPAAMGMPVPQGPGAALRSPTPALPVSPNVGSGGQPSSSLSPGIVPSPSRLPANETAPLR